MTEDNQKPINIEVLSYKVDRLIDDVNKMSSKLDGILEEQEKKFLTIKEWDGYKKWFWIVMSANATAFIANVWTFLVNSK